MSSPFPNGNQVAVFIDFENIALWAAQNDFNFQLTRLMEYLKSRGSVVIQRAYGDFGRLYKYHSELMENSIDMIHSYGIRAGKNRADIRMAIDALETVINRPQIHMFVIVSGDSDFGPLVSKLREYGRYTLGIGPRKITHDLLVKSCDEFVYLETVMGEMTPEDEDEQMDRVTARILLRKALQAHGQRGDIPVLASKLKQTMLSINPAFNEANFGYPQFKNWLEDNNDLIKLLVEGLQLYVAPIDFSMPGETTPEPAPLAPPQKAAPSEAPSLKARYEQVFHTLNLLTVDVPTRRHILHDIFRELHTRPGERTTDEILDHLVAFYEAEGTGLNKSALRQVWQMAFRQRAFDYRDRAVSVHVPVWLSADIPDEETFLKRAEASFPYAVIHDEMEFDAAVLAEIVTGDPGETARIEALLEDLLKREKIMLRDGRYKLFTPSQVAFRHDPPLQPIWNDLETTPLSEALGSDPNPLQAHLNTAKKYQRKKDFNRAAQAYLYACRLQWEALETEEKGADPDELRYTMASYASAKAGALYRGENDLPRARQYYLAFFYLVQEDSPIWERMNRLVPPLLSFYWVSAAEELGTNLSAWNIRSASAAEIALRAATSPDPALRKKWQDLARQLAQVNPKLLRQLTEEMKAAQAQPAP